MRHLSILIVSLCLCACTLVKVYPAAVPTSAVESVVVQTGDSLYGIASRHGVRARELARANGIAEPFVIHPGQRLRLPMTSGATTADAHEVAKDAAPVEKAIEVQPGDTLYGIASRNGTSVRELAQANALIAPFQLRPGQRLRLPHSDAPDPGGSEVRVEPLPDATSSTREKPATKRANTGEPRWQWPAEGTLVNMPRSDDAVVRALDIAGRAGSPVRATAAGTVLYSGSGSPGYEQLIVIEHGDGWISSYAHSRKLLIAAGKRVGAGAVIAEMGRVGATRDMVHFEMRHDGELVDPRRMLPKR